MKIDQILKVLSLLVLHLFVNTAEGAKILAIFPFPGPSQYILVQPYLKALAAKGHEVTAISAFPQKKPVNNYRDIEVSEVLKYTGDMLAYASVKMSKYQEILAFSWYYIAVIRDVLNNVNVQQLLKSDKEHFDLVIVETLQTDALYGIADHFGAPMIGFSSYGTDPYIDALVENVSPIAYSPLHTGTSTERMNFSERLENLWHNILMLGHRVFIQYPQQDKLYQEYFPHASRPLSELRQNFSVILLNQHFSLSYPRPYVTNMVEVGGFHIQHKAQPLPAEIDEFISSSAEGVIYFSMGSNIKSEQFPAHIRTAILETFAQLPSYIFLWKFENPALMANKPSNVYINKWFPQGDILAHPKVKLFITHGGLLSIMEAIYHGKPVLGMPIFFDQILNINRAQQYGYGLSVDYFNFNQTLLLQTIKEMLKNPQYGQRAKEISRRYHDQPMTPLDKALYWTEYVLRHRGADFLRSPAQNLNFWQRRSWDTAAVLMGAVILSILIFMLVLLKVFNIIWYIFCAKKSKEKTN